IEPSEKYFLDTIDAEIRFIGNILSVNTFKTIKSNQMHQMNSNDDYFSNELDIQNLSEEGRNKYENFDYDKEVTTLIN
ncbi:10654_t:CDS:2, partial [Entrophospora sp. SA101]